MAPNMQTRTFATGSHQARRRARLTAIASLGVFVITLAWLMAIPAQAATTAVSTCDEATLRATIGAAAPGDTITFGCSGTVTLTADGGGPISIDKDLTIDGTGQSVTVSGGGSVGVIEVGTGVTVTLSRLAIADGDAGSYGFYGGILNAGTLNLIQSAVNNNNAPGGAGGIRNWGNAQHHREHHHRQQWDCRGRSPGQRHAEHHG